jgi:hypothetical protein
MAKIHNTLAAVILSVCFTAIGSGAALAQDGSGRTTRLHAVHAHSRVHIYLAVDSWATRPSLRFVPSGGDSCDLPSSTCPNDQRISN